MIELDRRDFLKLGGSALLLFGINQIAPVSSFVPKDKRRPFREYTYDRRVWEIKFPVTGRYQFMSFHGINSKNNKIFTDYFKAGHTVDFIDLLKHYGVREFPSAFYIERIS